MTDRIIDQPPGATPLDDISGLLREEITTRSQLNEAESINILNAVEWLERGRVGDVLTVRFYLELHKRMFDQVWAWAGELRSVTGVVTNIGVEPSKVPAELGRVAMEYARYWSEGNDKSVLTFIAHYHHSLVSVHPFNNGNGRWARLACDAVIARLAKAPPITWSTDTLNDDSDERRCYMLALQQADVGILRPIEHYLETLNPEY